MADHTYFQFYVYDCPMGEREGIISALEDVLGEPVLEKAELGLWHATHTYGSASEDVGNAVAAKAPGATFLTWTDPAHDWLGSLFAYEPELGAFQCDCDANGAPIPPESAVRAAVLRSLRLRGDSAESMERCLDELYGTAWFSRIDELREALRAAGEA